MSGANGTAAAGRLPPAAPGENGGDLGGDPAGLAGDVGPAVAKGDDPVGDAGVVALVVTQAFADRVGGAPYRLRELATAADYWQWAGTALPGCR